MQLWREEQETAIAELAEECSVALHCVGEGHTAAVLAMRDQEARTVERARQVELNHQREVSRYDIALEKVRLRRKLESKPNTTAKRRKKVKDSAAQLERNLGRVASYKTNFKLLARPFSNGMLRDWFAVHKENLSLLQPSDYKHTFLHSHLFMNKKEANAAFEQSAIDAWKAAEVQRQILKSHKVLQDKIQYIMNNRKVLRGQLAGLKLAIEQKSQLLEIENHAIERFEREPRGKMPHHENVVDTLEVKQGGVKVKVGADKVLLGKVEQGLKPTSNGLVKQMFTFVENGHDDERANGEENHTHDKTTMLSGCNGNFGQRASSHT